MSKNKRPAKRSKKPPRARGLPVCAAMVFCNQVVVGEDKVPTVVRIVDTVGIPDAEGLTVGGVGDIRGMSMFISLKKGESSGGFTFVLSSVDPEGRKTVLGRAFYEAKGEPETGINITGPLRIAWGGEGLYWLELATRSGNLVARTPLKVFVGTDAEVQKKITARDAAADFAVKVPAK